MYAEISNPTDVVVYDIMSVNNRPVVGAVSVSISVWGKFFIDLFEIVIERW
jgi:hypothetical protein